jgi:hypothetical protein
MILKARPPIQFPGIIKGQKPTRLGHDFETFSEADLTDVGADAYSRHPSTEILMCSFVVDDGPVEQWVPVEGQKLPNKLRDAIEDERVIKTCWNKSFEWSMWKNVVGIATPHNTWRDTQALSYALALPGSLEKAGEVIEIDEEKKKSSYGRVLMRVFSSPRTPTKNKPYARTHWYMEPEKWEQYKDYNIRDTDAERAILKRLLRFDMPAHEWELWVIDQIINERGIPFNMEAVDAAVGLYEAVVERYREELAEITGLENPNSTTQLLPWLRERGYPYEDLQKGHVKRAHEAAVRDLEEKGPDEAVETAKRVLELRLDTARASPKKYFAIQRCVDRVERVLRNTFQFAGAGRTWRWAGRIFQPQNLPRPDVAYEKIIPMVVEHLEKLDVESIDLIYEDPMNLIVSCIRAVVQAPDGYLLFDADLNAIENRVLGWIAHDKRILRVFELDRDPYVDFATYMYHQPYDALFAEYKNGDKSKRTVAKPAVLGCLGSDTPVLTNHGWKRIVDVRTDDMVHDGVEFVAHGGVAYRGEKELLCRSGVYATRDHKFMTHIGWQTWQWLNAPHGRNFKSALGTASGLLMRSSALRALPVEFIAAPAPVGSGATFPEGIWRMENRRGVLAALLQIDAANSESVSVRHYSTFSQIVSTLREQGAKIPTTSTFSTTAGAEFVCGSRMLPLGSGTVSMFSGPTESLRSTAKITTEIMSREISGLPHDPSRTSISGPSWDIVNAGTRQCFVIMTDDGPLVAHNCGYQLGVGAEHVNQKTGEIEATGLLGYARNMYIILTPEQAKLAVTTFRETFDTVVDSWKEIERAAKRCVTTGKPTSFNMIRFDIKAPFLRMILPSNRALHYCRPRIEPTKTPWGAIRDQLTYEALNDRNQWVRIPTHGGKLIENADQAIARDILANGMKRAYYRGLDICLHVHDQIVGMAPEDDAEEHLRILQECMAEEEDWHVHEGWKLPLGSNGFTTKIFMKD